MRMWTFFFFLAPGVLVHPGDRDGNDMASIDRLSLEISSLIHENTQRVNREGFCLICHAKSRDIYNHRTHMLIHLKENEALWDQVQVFRDTNIVSYSPDSYTCFLCQSTFSRRKSGCKNNLTMHFILKHLLVSEKLFRNKK